MVDFSAYLDFVASDRRYEEAGSSYTTTYAVPLELQIQSISSTTDNLQSPPKSLAESTEPVIEPESINRLSKFSLKKLTESLEQPPEPVVKLVQRLALGNKREHIVLTGRPGSGKSTALQRLLLELTDIAKKDEAQQIPVLIKLKADRTIVSLICAEFRKAKQKVDEKQIDNWLIEERLILLLDGVNEIPSLERQIQVQEFLEENPSTPMIFTTRDRGAETLGIRQKVELQPLKEAEIKDFVQNYFLNQRLPKIAEKLLNQLKNQRQEVAATPLLLKMLCDTFDPKTKSIPKSKGQLFKLFSQKINVWKKKEGVRTSEKFWQWNDELLQHLAAYMLDNNGSIKLKTTIKKDEARRVFEKLLNGRIEYPGERAKDWLDDLIDFHLLQDSDESEKIEFTHQGFQDYYAAKWLHQQIKDEQFYINYFQYKYPNFYKFQEVIIQILDLVEDESTTNRLIDTALGTDIFLGSQLIGTLNEQQQENGVHKITTHIEQYNLPEWILVELLGQLTCPTARAYLASFIDSSNIDLSHRAAFLIGETQCQEAIDIAVKNLKEIDTTLFSQSSFGGADKNGDIWVTRVKSLIHLESSLALEYLQAKFSNSREKFIVQVVWPEFTTALNSIDNNGSIFQSVREKLKAPLSVKNGDYLTINLLGSSIQTEEDAQEILDIIENQPEDDIQAHLLSLVRDVKSSFVEENLMTLLCQAKRKLKVEITQQLISRRPKKTKILENYLSESDSELAWSSAYILANLKREVSLPHVFRILDSSKDPLKRSKAAKALIHFSPEQVTPQLLHSLQNESEDIVRKEVAFTLANLGRQEAIPELRKAIANGPGLNPRIFGIRGMAKLSESKPLWDLIKPSKEVCWQTAVVELLKLKQSDAKEFICDLIIDPGQESFSAILELITKYADEKMIKWLITALEFPAQHKSDKYFQNRVAFALNRCKPELLGCHLPQLKELYRRKNIHQLNWLIPATQSLCGFYSYTVYSESKARPIDILDRSASPHATLSKIGETVDSIDRRTQRMEEEPKISISNSSVNAPIGNQGNVINQVNTTSPSTSPKSATEKEVNWGQRIAGIGLIIAILTLAATIFPQEINQKIRNWMQPQSTESIEQQSKPNEEP